MSTVEFSEFLESDFERYLDGEWAYKFGPKKATVDHPLEPGSAAIRSLWMTEGDIRRGIRGGGVVEHGIVIEVGAARDPREPSVVVIMWSTS